MVVSMFDKLNLPQQLEITVRKEYEPKVASISDLTQNIVDCFEYDLDKSGKQFFAISNSPLLDIIEYVKYAGGYSVFDFVV